MEQTQEQIISRLEELLALPVEETMREANELKSAFYVLNHQKLDQQKLEHKELGAHMDDFIPIANPLEDIFKELFSRFKDNKAKFIHQKTESEKKNLQEKKTVLKDLSDLIDNEENIGKSFDRFKDLQDKWRSIGPVPKDFVSDLNTAYKSEVDRFYYNISINKELKEYDLSKNLEIRDSIVKKLEELQTESKISDIELILAAAKEEWEDAGPVKPEVFGALRDRYYEAVRVLHKKIQDFYSERKEGMQSNLGLKEQMVARVKELTTAEDNSLNKWNKATEEVFQIRENWKTVGPIERKHNNRVWEEFKEAQDRFFEKKKEFLGEARESFKEHKVKKEQLIERAQLLKDSTDWKQTTEDLIRLQNEWKSIGSAGQRDENKLWSKFRTICDSFFTSKKEFYDTMDDRQLANLKLKEELLTRISALKIEGTEDEKLSVIKGIGDEWAKIDHVPKKDIKRIGDAYTKAMDKLYGQLKMDRSKVEDVRFKNKVDRLSEAKDGADLLIKEEQFLRKRLTEKKEELMKYENNMGFFKHAKPDNPLLISAQKTIAGLQKEVDELTGKLRLLKSSIRSGS